MHHLLSRHRPTQAGLTCALLLIILSLLSSPVTAQGTISSTYCITGNSDGTGWNFAWEYDNGTTTLQGFGGSVLPVGATCGDFAQTMADSMNLWTSIPPEYVASASGCCLVVTMSTGWNWNGLWVGPNGNPMACLVTTAGCTFNPTIVLSEDPVGVRDVNWGALKSQYQGQGDGTVRWR